MQTKLHINVQQGVIDIEGEQSFVEKIFNEFKDQIKKQFANVTPVGQKPEDKKAALPLEKTGVKEKVKKTTGRKLKKAGPSCSDVYVLLRTGTTSASSEYQVISRVNSPRREPTINQIKSQRLYPT